MFWGRRPIFLMFLNLQIRRARYRFARRSPITFGATKGTKRANSKTSSVLCLLGIDRCGAPIRLSMRFTSHQILECDVCTSTLLPETLACTVSCKRSWSICTEKREATRVSWRKVHVFSAWRRSLLLTPFQVQAWCLDTAPLRAMFASCEDSLE